MPLHHRIRLIDHIRHATYQPSPADQIASEMRIEEDDLPEFHEAVDAMIRDGRLEKDFTGKLMLAGMPDEITGRLRLNPRGFGFIIPEERWREGDLFVPAKGIADAVSGDIVRAKVVRSSGRGRSGGGRSDLTGRVIEIIERGRSRFTGVLVNYGREWVVEPDGRVITTPIIVRDPEIKGAKEGDKVVVELTEYPEEGYNAEGVIVKVLGDSGRPDVETQATIEAFGLGTDFPESCVREAGEAARRFDAEVEAGSGDGAMPAEKGMGIPLGQREDLRDTFIFTIDPNDSKDFDDAISITFDEKKREWELGVHIADVAHFVRLGTELDKEAKTRGNSVYLPRLVLPMLPEVLSNGICSLHEGVPRYAKSAFVRFDARGRVVSQRYSATVISSAKRCTYEEAQHLIDGDEVKAREHARTDTEYTPELKRALKMADTLARTLRGRRQRDGMISLNLPVVELVFDDDGNVIDAVPEDDSFTHTVVEMFMVEANEAVARLFSRLGVPVLRRIHPDPSFGDVGELRKFAASVGFNLGESPDRHDIQRLLDRTRNEGSARAIHFAVLRTLTKAQYSPALIGHFALASDQYAHFTSPIRRYPDLQVHRCLEVFLEKTENGTKMPREDALRKLGRSMMEDVRCPPEDALVALGSACSGTEQNATAAERQLREFLVLSFIAREHLGGVFDGVVTGVTTNSVFISIERYLCEGMVKVVDLPNEDPEKIAAREAEKAGGGDGGGSGGGIEGGGRPRLRWEDAGGGGGLGKADKGKKVTWAIDDKSGRLVAKGGGGLSIGMGDQVEVRIEAVDVAARHIELVLTRLSKRRAHKPAGDADPGDVGEGGGSGRYSGSAAHQDKQRDEEARRRKSKQRRDREGRKNDRKRGGARGK
ncbi:MAG: ribonuclease R family protein [Phycisphaerales bacterium]